MADFNLADLYNTATGWLGMNNPQGTLSGQANAMIAPALATAAKQYSDAGQYAAAGEHAANTANPFGDRSMYRNRLDLMYTDPNYWMNDPSYNWRLSQGMANVNRMNNAQGYQGSGKSNIDLTNYAQNAASQEWEKEHNRLASLAGAQFDPANAAKYIMQGNELKLGAQNAALGSLFLPAMMQGTGNMIENARSGNLSSMPGTTGNFSPSQAAQLLKDGWKWITTSNGKGFFLDEATGRVTYAPGVIGEADQGGFVGDMTDPTQGFAPTYNPDMPTWDYPQEPMSSIPEEYSGIDPSIVNQYYMPDEFYSGNIG